MAVKVYTFASKPAYGFCDVVRSAIANNVTLHVLTSGNDDKHEKPAAFLRAAEKDLASGYPGLIMFVDGYDVYFQKPPSMFAHGFPAFGRDIVYGAEKNCWPFAFPFMGKDPAVCLNYTAHKEIDDIYAPGLTVRYMNTGCAIGKPAAFRDWFQRNVALMDADKTTADDQQAGTLVYLQDKNKVALDMHSTLFQNMEKARADVENHKGVYRNIKTKTEPGLIHFNGDKAGINDFVNQLWFNRAQTYYVMEKDDGFILEDFGSIRYNDVCPQNK